ncbi:LIM domain-containing protein, partial [Schistosoma bovis]
MLSSYQIPISNNNNNNQKKKNEHLSRIISLNNSIENLSSPRNTSSFITNSMNTNTVLSSTVNSNSNLGVNISKNNDYTNGNESIGNYPPSSSILGFNSRIFSNCAECGLRIINLIDTCYAMGYLYHNSCFVCCCCKRTLRGKVFYKDQDKIYCEEDYLYCGFQQTVEKCFACGHIIAETILLAVGKTYHPGCFRCCICTKCLDGIPFTIDSNNLIYCLPDYHLINGPLCAVCGLVIMPDEVSLIII